MQCVCICFSYDIQTMEGLTEMLRKENVTVTQSRFETKEGVQSLEDPFVS